MKPLPAFTAALATLGTSLVIGVAFTQEASRSASPPSVGPDQVCHLKRGYSPNYAAEIFTRNAAGNYMMTAYTAPLREVSNTDRLLREGAVGVYDAGTYQSTLPLNPVKVGFWDAFWDAALTVEDPKPDKTHPGSGKPEAELPPELPMPTFIPSSNVVTIEIKGWVNHGDKINPTGTCKSTSKSGAVTEYEIATPGLMAPLP